MEAERLAEGVCFYYVARYCVSDIFWQIDMYSYYMLRRVFLFYSEKRVAAMKIEAERVAEGVCFIDILRYCVSDIFWHIDNYSFYMFSLFLFFISEQRVAAAKIEAERIAEGVCFSVSLVIAYLSRFELMFLVFNQIWEVIVLIWVFKYLYKT